jgi:HSP20 family protein
MPIRNLQTWMWAEACELLDRAERLHRQYFRLGAPTAETTRVWEPPVDVIATVDELRITVALPGVAPDRLQIRADGNVLIVDALRPAPARGQRVAIHRLEIPYGRFHRRVALPPGRYEVLEQTYGNGCLDLRLAKR